MFARHDKTRTPTADEALPDRAMPMPGQKPGGYCGIRRTGVSCPVPALRPTG